MGKPSPIAKYWLFCPSDSPDTLIIPSPCTDTSPPRTWTTERKKKKRKKGDDGQSINKFREIFFFFFSFAVKFFVGHLPGDGNAPHLLMADLIISPLDWLSGWAPRSIVSVWVVKKRRRSLSGVPNHPSPPSDLSPNNKIHSVRDYIIQRKWRRAENSFVVRYSILVPFRGYYVEKKQNLSLFDSSVVCVCVCRRWPISYAVTHLFAHIEVGRAFGVSPSHSCSPLPIAHPPSG